jgi:hypothetical protein
MDLPLFESPRITRIIISLLISFVLGFVFDQIGLKGAGWQLIRGATSKLIEEVIFKDTCREAETHWKGAKEIGTVAAFEDHISKFPNCNYATLAKQNIDILKGVAAQPPPVLPPCMQEARFEEARANGVSGLRNFIEQCKTSAGVYISRATAFLEVALYRDSMTCIQSSSFPCHIDRCLGLYTGDFPNGHNIANIRRETEIARESPHCRPPERPSVTSVMRQFGMIGRWAADCSLMPTPINRHSTFSLAESGEVKVINDTGTDRYEDVILSAETQPGNKLAIIMQQIPQKIKQDVVMLVEMDSFRIWSYKRADGYSVVNNGNDTATGRPTTWRKRCLFAPEQHWCPHRQASAGWKCHTSQRCGAAGGCIGAEPARRPESGPVAIPAPVGIPGNTGPPASVGVPGNTGYAVPVGVPSR